MARHRSEIVTFCINIQQQPELFREGKEETHEEGRHLAGIFSLERRSKIRKISSHRTRRRWRRRRNFPQLERRRRRRVFLVGTRKY